MSPFMNGEVFNSGSIHPMLGCPGPGNCNPPFKLNATEDGGSCEYNATVSIIRTIVNKLFFMAWIVLVIFLKAISVICSLSN